MSNPNVSIKNNPYSAPQFYFPLNLGSEGHEPYVIFDIRDGVAVDAQSKGTIALYMPNDIKASYRAGYETEGFGIFGYNPSVTGVTNSVSKVFKDLYNNPGAEAGYLAGGVGQALGGISVNGIMDAAVNAAYSSAVNVNARAQRDFRVIVNPHMSVLFKGMGFRTFSMNWTLVPKSPEESDMINNIIYTFKYHMHPGYPKDESKQRFLLYPENFVIGFYSPSPNYLFQTSPCVLESCDVDYAGAGVNAWMGDTGAPACVTLSLGFKETEVLTKERISQGA